MRKGKALYPQAIALPVSSASGWEALEGMAVRFSHPYTVVDLRELDEYGQLGLSGAGRLFAPTHGMAPGEAAAQRGREQRRAVIRLDDASHRKYPRPLPFDGRVRAGDRIEGLDAVVTEGFGGFLLLPLHEPDLKLRNPRPAALAEPSTGRLRVAAFNVQNYFNGEAGNFSASRGAASHAALERQRNKLVAAILGLKADVLGLMELENDGQEPGSAAAELLEAVNERLPAERRYRMVRNPQGRLGEDAITVGLWYRPAVLEPTGQPEVLEGKALRDNYNRPILIQRFAAAGLGFTVAVNHWKSKGSDCEAIGDPDRGDGQGNCNQTRLAAAEALVHWWRRNPTPLLVVGDLNAHAQEDPVRRLTEQGMQDLVDRLPAEEAYTDAYRGQFGYLMHLLAGPELAARVAAVGIWHINADEPDWYAYDARQGGYQSDPHRSSDHDPVWLDLAL